MQRKTLYVIIKLMNDNVFGEDILGKRDKGNRRGLIL